ncbi:MAG: response regulator [Treponema sp.]|jgi:signal transduction histidine kinase|nr:response regulator [Treponema sp.]
MKKIGDYVIPVLTSGKYRTLQDDADMEAVLRLIVLNITYTIASVLIIALGATDMRNGNVDIGLVQVILGFMTFLNLFLLRTELPFIVGGLIITAVFGSFCGMSIFVKHEMHGLASLWIYSYPLMSIFTLGLPAGLIPALLLLVVAIAGTFGGLARFEYTVSQSALLCGVYFFVMILTAVYDYVRSFKDRWLARQDSYMNLVFDNSPDIIMLLDKNRGLVYCARVFLQKTKIKDFQEIRKTSYREVFSRFTSPEQLNEIITFFQTSREEKNPVTFERTLDFGNDGHPRHYEIHFTPMYNNQDVFQGAFILFHDLTDILDARDRAEQASRAKSNFLANMSHEIRTPLNAIIGMTAIARDSNEPARKDYCLDKIESASVHLLGIINDILDMSKIEENKFELSCAEVEFSAVIQRIVNIFEFRLGEKKQKLTVNQDPSIPRRIITDDQRLAQVITNLVGNAVKFTPEGGDITLSVARLADTEGFCTLEIRVTDTGIGIPKEQQGKLFQSFVQVDSSIARKFGGTGLGLAISRKIVQLMQGDIRIESEVNKGSSFIFNIRAEIPAVSSVEIPADEVAPDEQPDYHGKRILLAEDVEINREIVITVLEPLGLEIVEAEDGRKAYDLFCANPESFDLIFMDIHMPGIDGYDTAKLIRAYTHPRAQTVPIIAMTANVFREDVEHCRAAGMNGHVGKPLDFGAVMKVLKDYLA